MFRKMPILLILIIAALLLTNSMLPLPLKQCLFAISLTIKSIIIFVLPFVIFGLLFKAAVELSSGATQIILLIFGLVIGSNFVASYLSHYIGSWVYQFNLSLILPKSKSTLEPLWSFHLPTLIRNEIALFAGIFGGLISATFFRDLALPVAKKMEAIINKGLQSFIYIIPFFIAGFIVKLAEDGVVATIIKDYSGILAIIAVAQFSYAFLGYLLVNNGRFNRALTSLRNMVPAALCGFSSMSSAASMPLTIIGVERNAKHKSLVGSVVPATVNIHLLGDCIAVPVFAYAILKSYGMAEPGFMQYLVFVSYFVMARFSAAAIPGGGIIVMLPILESNLGFNAEMLSLITALYILFDPVITCANILCNGAFAKGIDRLIDVFGLEDRVPAPAIEEAIKEA